MSAKRTASAVLAPQEQGHLQIGEVAERTGVTQRTLRFYEEKGLLKPPSRMEGGFRLYSEDDVRRVEEIKRLQRLLDFTLAEIREMVEAEEVKTEIKASYRRDAEVSERQWKIMRAKEVTLRQVAVIDQKLMALQDMKGQLEQKLSKLDGGLRHLEEQARLGV